MNRGLRAMASPGVALTFDDGPHPAVTPHVLQLLESWGVRATFFLVGERAKAFPELARAIAAAGHGIGNHTQSHRNLLMTGPNRTRLEIASCQRSIKATAGVTPKVFRPPWGKLTRAARRACAEHGLVAYDWTEAPEGWPRPRSPEEIVRRALAAASPGAILDLHDVPWHSNAGERTLAALPRILQGIEKAGLRFETLPECGAQGDFGGNDSPSTAASPAPDSLAAVPPAGASSALSPGAPTATSTRKPAR